jgi:rhomboid family GlyGly-CTERM serine protease
MQMEPIVSWAINMAKYIPWIFIGVILFGGLLPESVCALLDFNLQLIKQGEVWRLFTGQWVHFGFNHSLMNALGLAIVQYSFLDGLPLRGWAIVQTAVLSAVAFGLLLFNPEIGIYRGYSGAFIGVLCFSLLHFWSRAPLVALIFFAGLTAKIVMEHLPNYDIHYLQSLIGVAVAVDAHLYGFLMGIIVQILFLLWRYLHLKAPVEVIE